MSIKFDLILHWKLFDMVEHPNGGWEVSSFFIKALFLKERTSYYIDTCGLGIDYLSTSKYNSFMIRLVAFSLHFQKKKAVGLKLV